MRVHVLALGGVFDTGLSSVLDAFSCANMLRESGHSDAEAISVRVVGLRRRVRSGNGLSVPVAPARESERPDVVIVPALAALMPEPLGRALEQPELRDADHALRSWSRSGALVGAACTGTFVLAGTGLLDGLPATTTWWLAPMFRERFPRVRLEESRMLVGAPGFVTAGAALGHLDLALWVIRQRSPALAALTARYMVVDARPSQAAFVIPDHLAHGDRLVERFEAWVRSHLASGFSLAEAARAVGTSERTLSRRLRAVLGKTPIGYVQDLRVERAVHLLQSGGSSVDQVATAVGYADGVTLRTLLRRKLGRGVRELRR